MKIIGLHNDEDAGVCFIKDGKLVDMINEERLTRKKLQSGFPLNSLRYILKKNRTNLKEIDYFAYGWHGKNNNQNEYFSKIFSRLGESGINKKETIDLLLRRMKIEIARDRDTYKKFLKSMAKLKIPLSKVKFFDHHTSHAWSAYSCSNFKKSLIFTMDARGDYKSASVSVANYKNGITELENNLSLDSLGYLYGQITYYLGFKPHRHEGKITGLAAYGNSKNTIKIFKKLINWNGKKIISNLGYFRPFFTNINPSLKKDLNKFSREDIAAGLQTHCENLVVKYINYWIKKTKYRFKNICLAGGIFANVKINQKIKEIKNVKKIFVFPHMGDGGLPLGAASIMNFLKKNKTKINFESIYLGPEYNDNKIFETLKKFRNKVHYEKFSKIENKIVNELINKKIVGFFQGRMEFGPRALGSRSILFHAKDKSSNNWLNKRLKRTEFMPFAPVTPIELASSCYENWKKDDYCTPFMTQTFKCKKDFIKKHPAVVHVDGTARPQVISKKINTIYYNVVKSYCKLTGEKALINTSFNQHEEPIVCKPIDAIRSLLKGNVDILAIGSFIVKKK